MSISFLVSYFCCLVNLNVLVVLLIFKTFIYRNLVSVFAEPVPHPKLLCQLSKSDNFGGELKNPEEPESHVQKTIKLLNTSMTFVQRGLADSGRLAVDHQHKTGITRIKIYMVEQLQNQLGEEKRRIRETEELMEREIQQQIQHNNMLQAELDKRETIIRQLSESQHRQLPEQEERDSWDNHSRVGPPSSNTLHVQRTMTQSAD